MTAAARAAAALAGAVALAFAASAPAPGAGAVALAAGFALLALACLAGAGRLWAAGGVAAAFTIYGGISALVALGELREVADAGVRLLSPFAQLGLAGMRLEQGLEPATADAFARALRLTAGAGAAAILAAAAVERLALHDEPRHSRPANVVDVERLGRVLTALGFLGVALALARFLLQGLPGAASPFAAIKSFWVGGSYLLLIAHLALPGILLWVSALLARGLPRREFRAPLALLAVYVAALAPAGQRTFAIEAVVSLAIAFVALRTVPVRRVAVLTVAVGVGLAVTQAVRNQVRAAGQVTVAGLAGQLAPGHWDELVEGQVASFRWTVEIVRHREALEFPDQLAALVSKPVPRQLWPGKPAGFSELFTEQAYPAAALEDVGFATPLVSEGFWSLGTAGAWLLHALLGALAGAAVVLIRRRSARVVVPLYAMTVAWAVFVFLRGDAANAAFAAAGWIVPAVAVLLLLRRRGRVPVGRVVVDALQVPGEFSGVGRQLVAIGQDLRRRPLGLPLVLRCPEDARELLAPAFPEGTEVQTPLARSRPRWRRLLHQQLLAPLRDGPATVLLCPGDQAPLLTRARVVLIVHDVRRLVRPDTASRSETAFYRAIQPPSIRRADAILTVSRFTADELRRTVPPRGSVTVVAHHPRPVVQAPPDGEAHILVVGALRAYKGVEDAIAALARLGEAAPPLVVVGSGEGREAQVTALAAGLGVSGRVRLAGWVPDEELERLYATAVMTVSPSHYEGYGLPVAESLARGVPTVASRIPSHVEIASDAAHWFDPGDVDALAAAIGALVADPPLRRDLARRGLERSRELQRAQPTWAGSLGAAIKACAPSAGSSPSETPAAARAPGAGTGGPAPAPTS